MRILIYFVDAHRRLDYKNNPGINPYMMYLDKLSETHQLVDYENYYSCYPNTYNWFVSTFNKTMNIDLGTNSFLKGNYLEDDPLKNSLFKIEAEMNGYQLRVAEIDVGRGRYLTNDGRSMLKDRMTYINPDYLFKDTTDKVIDFVYDMAFHDILFYDTKIVDSIAEKEQIFKESWKISEKYFNKELFDRYDLVWIVSDHGYEDYDPNWSQHMTDKLGNPNHHSGAILYEISKDGDPGKFFDKYLLDNTQLVDLWLNNTFIPKNFIVTHGYSSYKKSYPRLYWIIDKLFGVKYFNIDDFNSEEQVMLYFTNGHDPIPLPKNEFDKVWLTSPYIRELIDYEQAIKRCINT